MSNVYILPKSLPVLLNNNARKVESMVYQDYINHFHIRGTIQEVEERLNQTLFELETKVGLFYSETDDVSVVMRKPRQIQGIEDTSVSIKHLLVDGHDVSQVDFDEKITKIPNRIFKQVVSTGLPEDDKYYPRLLTFLALNGYEDIVELKTQLLKDFVRKLPNRIPINKDFIQLLVVFLSGTYSINNTKVTLPYSKGVLNYISKLGLKFTNDEEQIIVNSSFLYNLFITGFLNLSFLNSMPVNLKQLLIKLFPDVLLLPTHLRLKVQEFLFANEILTTTSDQYGVVVLQLLSPYDFEDHGDCFEVPVTSSKTVSADLVNFITLI